MDPDGLPVGNHNLRDLPARQEGLVWHPRAQPYHPVLPGVAAAVLELDIVQQPALLPPLAIQPDDQNDDVLINQQSPIDPPVTPPPPPAAMGDHPAQAKYPPTFHGKAGENVKDFNQKFRIYATIKGIHEDINLVKCHFGQLVGRQSGQWRSG